MRCCASSPPREVQIHLVREVQEVYRAQGVSIHDKHIEVIVRQMLRRVTIIDSGATEFLPGSLTERGEFESENRRVVAEGNEPAAGRPVLMGITKRRWPPIRGCRRRRSRRPLGS